MEQRRCFGCMELTDGPVCLRCGCSEGEQNLPNLLPRGTVLAGRFLVGRAAEQLREGVVYLALDQSCQEPVRLLEYFPAGCAHREGCTVEAAGPEFFAGADRFCRVSEALTGDALLAEISGTESAFSENGTFYRVSRQLRGSTLSRYVELRGGQLTPEETFRLLDGVIEALATLHRAGLSCGEVTPQAVVLDSRGGPRLPRLGEEASEPREDVIALCRMILGCIGSDPGEPVAGLDEYQVAALRDGLEGCYDSVGALAAALRGTPPEQPEPSPQPEPVVQPAPETPEPAAVYAAPVTSPLPGKGKGRKKGGLIALIAGGIVLVLGIAALIVVQGVHIWKEADCENPRTCALCGKTEGAVLEHSWQQATCTDPEICERCGAIRGSVLGHAWRSADCEHPKTCDNCGKTEGAPLGHAWQEATCENPRTCENCGQTEGEALGHDWQEATGTEPETCSRCGETRGKPKGYIEQMEGDWEQLKWGNSNTWCFAANASIRNVKSLTVKFRPEFNSGVNVYKWKFLYRKTDGTWVEYGSFEWNGGTAETVFRFSPTVDLDAVAVVPSIAGSYSYKFELKVTDIYFDN